MGGMLLTQAQSGMHEYVIELSPQLLHDVIITAVNVFILFCLLSYFLFNPAKKMLASRQEKIAGDLESAAKDKQEASVLREDYEAKLKNINLEAEDILSAARKKALKRESEIVAEANDEAARIIARANAQIELDKQKALDDMKKEMISIASVMAGKVVSGSMNTEIQESLLDETLNEIGEGTWQS